MLPADDPLRGIALSVGSTVLFAISDALLLLALVSAIRKRADWRTKLAAAEAGEG